MRSVSGMFKAATRKSKTAASASYCEPVASKFGADFPD